MGFITATEIANGLNLSKFGILGNVMGSFIMQTTRISELNEIYDQYAHLEGVEFINAVLLHLDVHFEIPEKDLKRIPKTGPFVTISNHPLGAIDGLILLKLLLEQRPDYKVVANFLLHRLEPLRPYVMPVNPFESRKEVKSSVGGIKQALSHIQSGSPFGVFPAGEVSTHLEDRRVVDKPWSTEAIRLIKKVEVPVIPVYFHARNSASFYRLAKLNDSLRTAKLPGEMLKQSHRPIRVRIGNSISVQDQSVFEDLTDYSNFLRRKTYFLANSFEKKNLLGNFPKQIKFPLKRPPKSIAEEMATEALEKEVQTCRDESRRLLVSNNYEVFISERKHIPKIVMELGRLREITFRQVGEGTNKSLDLDKYDNYYQHMFLWDNQANKIAGAYRMGLGRDIYKNHGIDGFYLNELFRFEPELHKMLSQSIEMGRAFITSEYQQKPMPLFLLWKGIVHCTLRFPEHKYLIGGVSISNKFSNFSKSMMIEFMKSNYYDPYVAQYVRPKKEFKVKLKDADKDFVFDSTQANLNKFDKFIEEIEPGNLRLPVLIKKYIKQNAKVVAFNVDPLFNNAIDGLMYIRIEDIPESTVKPVMEEFQAELEQQNKI
ncbi:lysophospholipid acyltransferase family protein [Psychroflexus sp. CAK8W]|uniref:Lysophospholipid acyltransferase family protein n=1 Tax=Psychroflexus longus TaxID=2873596 RepID=A0ABS7XHR8_9FLAO|nr:lysophospholipid acyltransferase family protein [Psychroflexus longus]MBZ9777661.1 lysophospholipid acyltransferase family protein [Psychroflexus longus]